LVSAQRVRAWAILSGLLEGRLRGTIRTPPCGSSLRKNSTVKRMKSSRLRVTSTYPSRRVA